MSVDQTTDFVKQQKLTSDQFMGGKLTLAQPEKGFRAGTDSVFLGASVNPNSINILDLGCGAGAAGLVALQYVTGAKGLLVEKRDDMAGIAQHNIVHNNMEARARAVCADITASGPDRVAAGIHPDHFTSVLANPPYFDVAAGTHAPDMSRKDARHMGADGLERWAQTALAAAAPRGEVIFIYPADGLAQIVAAFASRFGKITILPLVPRPGKAATRVLIRGIKGSRAPLTLLSPLNVHEEEGNQFAPRVKAVLMGENLLDW